MAGDPSPSGEANPVSPALASSPPTHVAIIMDGNGRWAKARGLPRSAGHKRGAERVKEVVRAAMEAGVGTLTLFGFSSENWGRPETEVRDLMGLLRLYLKSHLKELAENGVRLKVIGDRARLPADVVDHIAAAERDTAANTALTLCIALSYGGRQEIAAAARALAEQVAAGQLAPQDITEDRFGTALETAGLPDPDLVIRTSGEMRVSNFLLWQMAYAEFVFSSVLWPDFDGAAFHEALAAFGGRNRRYGGVERRS